MTRRIKWGLSIGLVGCRIEDVLEVEDNATPEEIEEEVREVVLNHVEWWHEEEKPGEAKPRRRSGSKGDW